MHAEEPARLELLLQLGQREGGEIALAVGEQVAVVVLRHDVEDLLHGQQQLLAGLLHGHALHARAARGGFGG
jgi:hypothetical protein